MSAIRKITVVFFLTVCLPVAGLCDTAGAATCDAGTPRKAEMRSLLNIYSAFTDEYFNNVLRGLRLLASTHEVGSGRWDDMKGLLTEFDKSGIAAAAVWYARPDGRYYTVEKGLMGERLNDRAYFSDLMGGKSILGSLVVSKSTGKRSAVIAVPVIQQGKVVGAIGATLFLDKLSEKIAAMLSLKNGESFYALAPDGRTVLHSITDRHFLDPRELGSGSLRKAAEEMLSRDSGEVSYEYDNALKHAVFSTSPLTHWKFAITRQ